MYLVKAQVKMVIQYRHTLIVSAYIYIFRLKNTLHCDHLSFFKNIGTIVKKIIVVYSLEIRKLSRILIKRNWLYRSFLKTKYLFLCTRCMFTHGMGEVSSINLD